MTLIAEHPEHRLPPQVMDWVRKGQPASQVNVTYRYNSWRAYLDCCKDGRMEGGRKEDGGKVKKDGWNEGETEEEREDKEGWVERRKDGNIEK